MLPFVQHFRNNVRYEKRARSSDHTCHVGVSTFQEIAAVDCPHLVARLLYLVYPFADRVRFVRACPLIGINGGGSSHLHEVLN